MENTSTIPRIFADFNNRDQDGRVRLNTIGTFNDLSRLGISLKEGMKIIVSDSELEVEAVASFLNEPPIWVAYFDPDRLRDVQSA